MKIKIPMPKLGESVVEGTIGRWLKAVGDEVVSDEPLVEVDTDKVSAEIPSPVTGIVEAILVREGEVVAVGEPIALINQAEEGTEVSDEVNDEKASAAHEQDEIVAPGPAAERETGVAKPPHRYTPAVRHLASTSGLDPATVQGTGEGGRVTRRDMEAAMARSSDHDSPGQDRLREPIDGDSVLPLSRMRRAIAAHMVESKRTVPHAWTMVEVDVTSLVRFRESIKEEFRQREGFNITYLAFVIKAAVEGLREYPILNSQWDEERIVVKKRVNIGIAVDLEDGLVVPVIKDADQKSTVGLARSIHDLATRARAGALLPDDVQGGTFTINNTGAFGSVMSAPIIHYPQAAILSMETINRRPVVVGEGIAIRSMVNLCVSLDHRVLDGAVIGRFLRSVKRRLESYDDTTPIY